MVQFPDEHGQILDISPCKFPGKPWLTKRWDVLIQLSDGLKKLTAPVVFQLNGYDDTIVCSWRGSKKACLKCKCAGHSTSFCPGVNPKVGETVNPHQKIDNNGPSGKGKYKGSELSSDFSMEVPPTPASAQPPLTTTTTTAAGILVSPLTTPGSPAPRKLMSFAEAFPPRTGLDQSRSTTPPNTKHPSPASAGNSPARKQRNTQTGTRMRTRAATRSESVCPFCDSTSSEHDPFTCPKNPTLPKNTYALLATDENSKGDGGTLDDPME